jgi:signal transduction histidine kinase
MKLFTRYSRINFAATTAVLVAGSIIFYFIIHYVLIRQLDETLKVEEAEILDFVSKRDSLPPPANYKDQHVRFYASDKPVKRGFFSSILYDTVENEKQIFRVLRFPINADHKTYIATVSKSQVETEDLLFLMVLITIGIIVLLLFFQFIINRLLVKKMWRPFHHTLQTIKQFTVTNQEEVVLPATNIDEFTQLNNALNLMTEKMRNDYVSLKSFADTASHEMQTPLAVINSKLDLLIQDQSLDEKQTKQLAAMYDAVGRLRKLNQSLLLITKIENQQFLQTSRVNLRKLIENKLIQLEELIVARHLNISTDLADVSISINPYLADILLNNLLTNAIRHNTDNGTIIILLQQQSLSVRNTGHPLGFDASRLFDRFRKDNASEGVGLGLAIVKQICDSSGFTIQYRYDNGQHIFTIDW